jgi:hypothetical protein
LTVVLRKPRGELLCDAEFVVVNLPRWELLCDEAFVVANLPVRDEASMVVNSPKVQAGLAPLQTYQICS